jgi:hypothetical protein
MSGRQNRVVEGKIFTFLAIYEPNSKTDQCMSSSGLIPSIFAK